jgi:RNA polymerase primary sigma factor
VVRTVTIPVAVPEGARPLPSLDDTVAVASPRLTGLQERELAVRIADGDVDARDQFILANLDQVLSIAHRYLGRGLPREDLIAEGTIGLMRAVEKFDPDVGTRFATYADYWIRQAMRIALSHCGHLIRLPYYTTDLLSRWRTGESGLRSELARDPDSAEVAARIGLTPGQAEATDHARKVSTNGWGSSAGLAVFPARGGRGVGGEMGAAEDARTALRSLDRLGERSATVLRLRFGLDGGEAMTLVKVGEQIGLTAERVRQIEKAALRTLRRHIAD